MTEKIEGSYHWKLSVGGMMFVLRGVMATIRGLSSLGMSDPMSAGI